MHTQQLQSRQAWPSPAEERVAPRLGRDPFHAVRDAAVRATVTVGLGAIAVIHAVDGVGKWSETRYLFWLYMALVVAAVAIAGAALFQRSRLPLLAAAGLAATVLAGYVLSRTTGLPSATGDIGNWTEPLGLASLVVEAFVVVVGVGGYLSTARPAATRA
jgi:Na+/melibiose symporter-like transporter